MPSTSLMTLAAFIVALAWLAKLTLPTRQALRVRNAFLLRRGSLEDFAWTPERVPDDFRVERFAPPASIAAAVDAESLNAAAGDWPRALALVTMFVRYAKYGGHARADLATTYREIVAGGGSCADYVRVYMAAAAGAGLFCRQWAFSFDGFGPHGHTFVEVFDREHRRWAFVDVHNNVYAVESGTDAPIDALTLRRALLAADPAIEFRQAGQGRLGWPHLDKLLDYYRRGTKEWYLWWGNDVIARDSRAGRWGHRLRSALGRLPPLVALVTPENEAAVAQMERLRQRVRLAAVIVCTLLVGMVVALPR